MAFVTPRLSGLDLLRRTGLELGLTTMGPGTAVCSIEGTGCDAGGRGGCFCATPTFWGYWTRDPGQNSWHFSDVGAGARSVRDGSLDAWVWGRNGGPAPPRVSLAQICAGGARATATGSAASAHGYVEFGLTLAVLLAVALAMALRRRLSR